EAVVVFEDGAGAALGGALVADPEHGVAHGLGGPSCEGGDVGDGIALGDDELDHGVAQQSAGGGEGEGAEAGDLADLVAFDVATPEGFDVDAEQGEVLGGRLGGTSAAVSRWGLGASRGRSGSEGGGRVGRRLGVRRA